MYYSLCLRCLPISEALVNSLCSKTQLRDIHSSQSPANLCFGACLSTRYSSKEYLPLVVFQSKGQVWLISVPKVPSWGLAQSCATVS